MSVAECRSRHVKPCIALARATNQDFYGRRLAATHLPDSYIAWIGRHGMRVESQQKRPASLLWHDGGSKKQYCGWSGVKVVTPRCRAADSIAADSIAADSIAADSIAADSIAADSIAADSIAADSIVAIATTSPAAPNSATAPASAAAAEGAVSDPRGRSNGHISDVCAGDAQANATCVTRGSSPSGHLDGSQTTSQNSSEVTQNCSDFTPRPLWSGVMSQHGDTGCATWQQPGVPCLHAAVFPTVFAPGAGSDRPPPHIRTQDFIRAPRIPCRRPHGAQANDNTPVLRQCAAVFPCGFDPHAGTVDPPLRASTRARLLPESPHEGRLYPKHLHNGPVRIMGPACNGSVPTVHQCASAVFPLAFSQPTGCCVVPSFTGLLNSISPSQQHQRPPIPTTPVGCFPPEGHARCCRNSHGSPCALDECRITIAYVHQQQQQQQKEEQQRQRDLEVHIGATALELDSTAGSACTGSSEACLLNRPSTGSRTTRQEREERQERELGWFTIAEDAPGLHAEGRPAADTIHSSGCEWPDRSSVSEDGDDEELQDTASS